MVVVAVAAVPRGGRGDHDPGVAAAAASTATALPAQRGGRCHHSVGGGRGHRSCPPRGGRAASPLCRRLAAAPYPSSGRQQQWRWRRAGPPPPPSRGRRNARQRPTRGRPAIRVAALAHWGKGASAPVVSPSVGRRDTHFDVTAATTTDKDNTLLALRSWAYAEACRAPPLPPAVKPPALCSHLSGPPAVGVMAEGRVANGSASRRPGRPAACPRPALGGSEEHARVGGVAAVAPFSKVVALAPRRGP